MRRGNEGQPKRIHPIKAAGVALGLAMLEAACGGQAPATVSPTRTPEATSSPTPSLMASPTQEVTPSPTIIVTPVVTPSQSPDKTASPTPRATETVKPSEKPELLGIDTIISDNPDQIDPSTIKDLIGQIYADNPHVGDLKGVVDGCADKNIDILEQCFLAIKYIYGRGDNEYWGSNSGYLATEDARYYQLAKDFYNLAIETHTQQRDKDRLDGNLRQLFPQN